MRVCECNFDVAKGGKRQQANIYAYISMGIVCVCGHVESIDNLRKVETTYATIDVKDEMI